MTAEMVKGVLEYALHFLAAQKFGKALPVNPPDWMHLAHVNIALEERKSMRGKDPALTLLNWALRVEPPGMHWITSAYR